MKSFAVVFAAVLVSLVAVSESRYYEASDEVATYSIVDSVIKAILDSLRPKLADIKIDDVNQTIRNPSLNATILVNDIGVKNADKFVIKNLKSGLVPLKLTNLTLTWDEIKGGAIYDVNSSVLLGGKGPFNLFGKGNAKAILNDVFFTIGANVELKDKTVQIKPKGLFGFDLILKKVNVTFSSLMGSTDLGRAVGVFFSKMIPELVDTLKKPIFDAFQDDIINFVNQFLKEGTTFLMEDEQVLPEDSLDSLDLSSELDSSFNELQNFDLASEETENF